MRLTCAPSATPPRARGWTWGSALLVSLGLAGACGVPQSEECQAYLACQAYFDDLNQRDSDTNIYQPDGVCWENDDLSRECSLACQSKQQDLIDRLEASEADLDVCAL